MKTIEIQTSHNVTIEYELAGLGTRMGALMIDLLVLFFYWIIIFLAGAGSMIENSESVFVLIMLIPAITYSFWTEFLFSGQTLGKMAVGIRVVNIDGRTATIGNYFIRWSVKLIDLWFSSGGLGAIFITSSFRNQRIGDVLAGTTVIKNKASNTYSIQDILKIKNSSEHQPKYLNVVRFTDEDMILIKTALSRINRYPNSAHKKLINDLVEKCTRLLNIKEAPKDKVKFLNTLLQDYIVLTR